ncbi:hypothetical protein BGZ60DRAFT_517589 [Tricladium varicosporioides]|nr:hypothetical protein BGZ60DRAFT_517589 [Hymenoscyphus varicosporioides]
MAENSTLEWFGATTFRFKSNGITMFLDAWLHRPSTLDHYLSIDDVEACDYIFISHAHFDHLPGADRLAKRTGATIVANGEAIHIMRAAGVPESQLMAVAGGERIPLFTAEQRKEVADKAKAAGPPTSPLEPPQPDTALVPITVHVWPSLHCLMPAGDHRNFPERLDTGTVYTGCASHACTMDITRGLTYGLGALTKMPSLPPQMPEDMKIFIRYLGGKEQNRCSPFDGGQIMYNFLLGTKVLVWNGHLGGYEGILRSLVPKPDVAILGIAGRGNLNGRPFDGSAAQFATKEVKWLAEPKMVIWCLHDKAALNPKYIDTKAASKMVEEETKSKVLDLEHTKVYKIFQEDLSIAT